MEMIKVKKEKYAERCEICHKKDYFDPIKSYCFRCGNVEIVRDNLEEKINSETDVFGRHPIIAYLDLQANILRNSNINTEQEESNKKILTICTIKGFKVAVICSCIIFSIPFSIPSWLLVFSFSTTQILEVILRLLGSFLLVLSIFIFVGTGVGFCLGILMLVFKSLKKILVKKRLYLNN